MAEGRMLKRNVSDSRRLAALKTDSARLLWTWILPYLDREGRFYASPDIIKGKVVPRIKTFTEEVINNSLVDMNEVGLIVLYEVDGEQYLQFRNFDKFQKIRKDKEGRPLPGVEEGNPITTSNPTPAAVHDNSRSAPGFVPPKLREEKLREVNRDQIPDVDNTDPSATLKELFNKVLIKYPRKNWHTWLGTYNRCHPEAILHTFQALLNANGEIDNPIAYCDAIIKQENQNYNARDFYAKDDKGASRAEAAQAMASIAEIMAGKNARQT